MGRKRKNKILESVLIEKVGHGGVGIGTLENKKKVLIKGNIIPGCTVKCFVKKERKDFLETNVLEVLNNGNQELVEPKCPHYNNIFQKKETDETIVGCGGCKWQILSYNNQLKLKMQVVSDSFRHQNKILENTSFRDIIGTGNEFFYRNKIEFSFGKYIKKSEIKDEFAIKKDFQMGFHKQGMFSKVIDVCKCFLIGDKMNEIFFHTKNLCLNSNLPVHDQKSHQGFFRHLVIREGKNTNQILVNLVVSTDYLNNQEKIEIWENFKKILKKDEFLTSQINSFCITNNNGLADIVRGENIDVYNLWGDGVIFEELHFTKLQEKKDEKKIGEAIVEDGQVVIKKTDKNLENSQEKKSKSDVFGKYSVTKVSFRVSPFSFFQTNTHGAEILFSQAFDLIGQINGTIFDLYCGTGSIGISFLKQGKGNFVVGVEIVKDAIIDAKYNAKINGLEDKTYFIDGKAEDLVYSDLVIQEKVKDLGLIIIDPPRDGLHKNVIKFLNNIKKQHQTKLLYISCNPVTMARDLGLLSEGGRKTDILQPVDMFPQTYHTEMIGILK